MNKKKLLTIILMFLYSIRIIDMYFSTKPLPPFYQLLIMLLFGYALIFIGSLIFFAYLEQKKTRNNNSSTRTSAVPKSKSTVISYHKKFNVAGVTYDCALGARTRQSVLWKCSTKDKLYLKKFEYKGKPAYYIVLEKNNLDIGCVPASLVDTIEKYKGRNCEIVFDDIDSFYSEKQCDDVCYAKVQFLVYKD